MDYCYKKSKTKKILVVLSCLVLVSLSQSIQVNSFTDFSSTLHLPGDSSFALPALNMYNNNSIYLEIIIANGSELRYYILTSVQYSHYTSGIPSNYVYEERIYDLSIDVHKVTSNQVYYVVFYNPTLQTVDFHYIIKSQKVEGFGMLVWLQIFLIFILVSLFVGVLVFIARGSISRIRDRKFISEIKEERKDIEKPDRSLQTREEQRVIANRLIQRQKHLLREEKLMIENKQKALVLYNEGMKLKLQKDLELAEEKFKEAIKFDENNYEIWFGLAEAHLQLSKNVEASEAFQKVISLKPDHIESLISAAILQLLPIESITEDKLASAEKLLRKATYVDRNDERVWNELGKVLEKAGKSSEAQEAFKQADLIKLIEDPRYDPKLSLSENTVGQFLMDAYEATRLKNNEKAISIYLEVLNREPENQVALANLGTIYVENKSWNEAETTLRKALQFDTVNIDILEKLRTTVKAQGNVMELEMITRKLVVLKANDLESWHDLILSLIAQEKLAEAESNCIYIMNDYTSYSKFWVLYTIILTKLERVEETIEVFQRAEQLDSSSKKHLKIVEKYLKEISKKK